MPPPDARTTATDSLAAKLQGALGASYEIERELGGGGMSRVFLAADAELGRRVVIKVLREDVLEGLSRERFRREVLVSANLQHPNIVGVIAAGSADGLPYFVMPYVEGESLRAMLRREGSLGIPHSVAILRDIARALAFAHARGIVHRDIKPDNVLMAGGAAMVADFGVAKALVSARENERHPHGTLTGAGISLGTPAYMSPEQVAGDPDVDHRADIYAFGATGYELLTGQPPFARRSVAEQMSAHLVDEAAPVSTLRPGVPAALEQLIARCLEKEPSRRPQSANEILTLLDDPAVVSGEVASAQTPSLVLRRRVARRWWPVAAAAIALLVGAGAWLAQRTPVASAPAAAVVTPALPDIPLGVTALAVFPLVSIAQDTSDNYIAAGMTEALTNAFAGLPSVRVTSRTAVEQSLRLGQPLAAVARQLGVTMYVEGTVQSASDRLRVTVRLVDADDGFTVWSDVYESTDKDLLGTQSEIAAAVAEAFSQGTFDPAVRQAAKAR
ncbi:MAG: protein kinase [Gemmatimonadaceae bacterium]|nr:protein kinase [Gemmatimonadaceae bacterium]